MTYSTSSGNGKQKDQVTPQIVRAMCDGDHEAFHVIYSCYLRSLHFFLSRLTGSSDESEEIMQDVFVKVWENRSKIDPQKNIKSYIFTIAKNEAFRYLKERKRYGQIPDSVDWLADDHSIADEKIIAKDTQLLIEIAISNMSENRRKVFELHQQGNSYEEIATLLGITQDNARQHVTRARGDIRKLLSIITFFVAG